MSYRWKPSKAQKDAYIAKLKQKELLESTEGKMGTKLPIRTGCFLKFYSMNKGKIIEGQVVKHSYGKEKNQHTFTINTGSDSILVKGRNLYPNILEHVQGLESKLVTS